MSFGVRWLFPRFRPCAISAQMGTLAEIKARGEGLRANCGRPDLTCGHGERLDLDMLIDVYGPDYDLINETRIAKACKCKACGHKGVVIHLVANSKPTGKYGTTQAVKEGR